MALSLGKLLENIDQRIDSTTLDEFRDHLETSLRRREKALEKEYSSLTEDDFEDPRDIDGYKAHLEDQAFYANEVRKLGHELCIVALYRQIEIHSKRVVKRNFPSLNERQLFNIATMKTALPFDLDKTYDRLLPLVQQYTKAFVSAAYANSAKYKI